MRLIDLSNGNEALYSHSNPTMAFAQYYASENSLNSKFATDPSYIVDKIKGSVRKGNYGYHMGDYSIPFSSISQ